jgi:hypothetical protein
METNYLKTQGLILVGAFDSFLTGFFAATFFNAFLLGEIVIFGSACLFTLSFFIMINKVMKWKTY